MNRTNATGATPGGYSDSGNTSVGSPTITNLGSTGGINAGDYVEVSAGFPPWGYLRVIAKTVNTITLEANATSTETGVSVTSKAKMYTDGLAGIVSRTVMASRYMNLIQEELCNLVVGAGGALSDVVKNQLVDLVVRINGGQIMTGDLGFPSYQLVKKITGTQADTTKNIQMAGGGYYEINTLAAATTKTLFEFGSIINSKRFLLDLCMFFLYDGTTDRLANFKGITRTGQNPAPAGETLVITPQEADSTYANLTTPLNLGGFYVHEVNAGSPPNDSAFDGTNQGNQVPMLIIRHNKIDIRNTHTANSITGIKIFLKTGNLFLA